MNKRGQMKISFGMIFSIILIVTFLSFAGYGIMKFLNFQKTIQVGQFTEDLQNDIDRIWQGSQGSAEEKYYLPDRIQYVCFVDWLSSAKGSKSSWYQDFELISQGYDNNLFFYPIGSAQGLNSKDIKHLNVTKITQDENPYCISNSDKINLIIKMGLGDSLVEVNEK